MPMKKEDVISAGVMTIVSILVLIGFTVAWFTDVFSVITTGMHLKAAEMNNIKIALTSGGDDISVLGEDEKYADIGLQDMTNVETNKLAPGQYGEVTFYITPSNEGIEYCEIVPEVWIRQGDEEWYPGEADAESDTESGAEGPGMEESELALAELYRITQEHIFFFEDEAMTTPIKDLKKVEWSEADGMDEKEVKIYWKWYYEYPFTDLEMENLDEEQKQSRIDAYDAEDTQIGNNITAMKFHFAFAAK